MNHMQKIVIARIEDLIREVADGNEVAEYACYKLIAELRKAGLGAVVGLKALKLKGDEVDKLFNDADQCTIEFSKVIARKLFTANITPEDVKPLLEEEE